MAGKSKKKTVKIVPRPSKKTAKANQELTRLGGALRALGGLGGGMIGGIVGHGAAGSGLGTSLGAAISRWLGSGDYTVSANTIVNKSLKASSAIPAMHTDQQSVRIAHKEYLGEISGAGTFTVAASYELNPGNRNTFPWLSGIAAQFQEYSFKGIVFHYVPSSGTAISGTNSALGTVMMQTSYRSTDSAPASKIEFLNEYWSSESVPSEPFAHPIECNPKENPFNVQYVRTTGVPPGDSKLLYDLGITHLAVSGQQGTNIVGDLWVTYDIELKKPIVASNVTSDAQSVTVRGGGTIDYTNYFGTAPTIESLSTIPINVTGRTLSFGKNMVGLWSIALDISATTNFGAGLDLGTTPTVTGCILALRPDGSTFSRTNMNAGTSVLNRAYALASILVTDSTATPTFTYPTPTTGTGTIGATTLMVTRIA